MHFAKTGRVSVEELYTGCLSGLGVGNLFSKSNLSIDLERKRVESLKKRKETKHRKQRRERNLESLLVIFGCVVDYINVRKNKRKGECVFHPKEV